MHCTEPHSMLGRYLKNSSSGVSAAEAPGLIKALDKMSSMLNHEGYLGKKRKVQLNICNKNDKGEKKIEDDAVE